jgi:hypothetical protein
MKPSVGLTVLTSSPMIFLTMVVFPALSRPLSQISRFQRSERIAYSIKILISLSFSLAFRKIDNIFAFFQESCGRMYDVVIDFSNFEGDRRYGIEIT